MDSKTRVRKLEKVVTEIGDPVPEQHHGNGKKRI